MRSDCCLDSNKIFIPTKTIAWIIGIEKYDKVREAGEELADLKQVP